MFSPSVVLLFSKEKLTEEKNKDENQISRSPERNKFSGINVMSTFMGRLFQQCPLIL